MRIGMILDASFPPDQRVEKEALSLIAAGHNVFLFSLDFKPHHSKNEVYKGIQIRRYPAGKVIYKLSALAYTFPFYRWLVAPLIKDFINQNSIQALHIHDMVIAEAGFSANKNLKLPVVLDLHENRPEIMREYKHIKSLTGKLLINLRKWRQAYYNLINRADYVVVVADLAKHDIVTNSNKLPEQVVVVPNTINKSEFLTYPLDPSVENRMRPFYNLLYIGDTSLRRGTDIAIKAVGILKDNIPNVRLWIVGKSSADAELKKLVEEAGLNEFVIFEGWKDVQLLPSYITYCQVALSPLKRNIHHDTTYANKIFQYMALGKPVVVSDCTTQAQLVKNEQCGIVYKAEDTSALTVAILTLFYNPDEANRLGLNGVSAVHNRWHWENTTDAFVSLYNVLLLQQRSQ